MIGEFLLILSGYVCDFMLEQVMSSSVRFDHVRQG
jgi:hypothetical protein